MSYKYVKTEKPRRVTLSQLMEAGACKSQRELFEKTFGRSVEVTSKLLKHANSFNFGWAIRNLLRNESREKALDQEFKLRDKGTPFLHSNIPPCPACQVMEKISARVFIRFYNTKRVKA